MNIMKEARSQQDTGEEDQRAVTRSCDTQGLARDVVPHCRDHVH